MTTSITSLLRVGPRKAKTLMTIALLAGCVPMLHGSPGIGKSSVVHLIGKEYQMKVIDHRLSTSRPEDMTGLPRFNAKGQAVMSPFQDIFPLEGEEVPDGYQGWILFLDEFNSADDDVQKAAYKLILDRMVGQHKLHENVWIICAGNLATDRAITSEMSTAMQSRVVHLEMKVEYEDWFLDVAQPNNYDPRLMAFLARYQDKLMDFDPNHKNKTFSCPRTYQMLNAQLGQIPDKKGIDSELYAPLLAGTITAGIATEFIQFTKVYDQLPDMAAVLNGTAPVPDSLDLRWATLSMLTRHIDAKKPDELRRITTYADKFELSIRILFYRMVLLANPTLRRDPTMKPYLLEFAKYCE